VDDLVTSLQIKGCMGKGACYAHVEVGSGCCG